MCSHLALGNNVCGKRLDNNWNNWFPLTKRSKKKKKDWTKTFLNPCCTSYSAFLVPMTNLVIQVFFSSSEIKIAASKMILKTSLLNISINLHVICRNKVSMRRSIKAIPRKNVIEHFEKQVEISRLKKSGFAQKGM